MIEVIEERQEALEYVVAENSFHVKIQRRGL